MLAEVDALIGELSVMDEMKVSTVSVRYVLERLKASYVEGAARAAQGVWLVEELDEYADDGHPVYAAFRCGRCGYIVEDDGQTLPSCCPNCGAKMSTVSESDTGNWGCSGEG